MKNIVNLLVIMFLSVTVLVNCNQNKGENFIKYDKSGKIERLSIPKGNNSDSCIIEFFENGNMKSISNFQSGAKSREFYEFFKDGQLSNKITLTNGKANGLAVWFYPSGNISATRFYKNDVQSRVGTDYWDKPFIIFKAVEYFNEQGEVFYKENFDSLGNFKNSEGKKPEKGF